MSKSVYMMMLKRVFFQAVFLLFFSGCREKEPLPDAGLPEKPQIVMLRLSPEAGAGMVCGAEESHVIPLHTSQVLRMEINFKARAGLAQYKIDIHSNFDCHSHRTVAGAKRWQLIEIEQLEGTDYTLVRELVVPDDIQAGDYHFMLQALDQQGNEADMAVYSLQVRNQSDTSPPEVEIRKPSTTHSILTGSSVEIALGITDNSDLQGGRIEISYSDPGGTEYTVEQYYFGESGQTADYRLLYDFPLAPVPGKYTFTVQVYDASGNHTTRNVYFEISR